MKLILREDVRDLGRSGELVEVNGVVHLFELIVQQEGVGLLREPTLLLLEQRAKGVALRRCGDVAARPLVSSTSESVPFPPNAFGSSNSTFAVTLSGFAG